MADDKQVYIRLRSKSNGAWFVHPNLRNVLIEDALTGDTSLNDIVNRRLAEQFRIPYEPSGRRSKPSEGGEEYLIVRLTEPIRRQVMLVAAQNGQPWQDVLRRGLCDAYGLAVPDAVAA